MKWIATGTLALGLAAAISPAWAAPAEPLPASGLYELRASAPISRAWRHFTGGSEAVRLRLDFRADGSLIATAEPAGPSPAPARGLQGVLAGQKPVYTENQPFAFSAKPGSWAAGAGELVLERTAQAGFGRALSCRLKLGAAEAGRLVGTAALTPVSDVRLNEDRLREAAQRPPAAPGAQPSTLFGQPNGGSDASFSLTIEDDQPVTLKRLMP